MTFVCCLIENNCLSFNLIFMKNNLLRFFVLSVLFSSLSFVTYAQRGNHGHNPTDNVGTERVEEQIVSYNTPFSYELTDYVRWEVINTDSGSVITSGRGSVRGVLFKEPGNYSVNFVDEEIHDPNSCSHPDFPDKLLLSVSPFKMDFDFSSIKLSKNLVGNQSTNGTTLKVDVFFSSYDNNTAVYSEKFSTAGVKTSVVGKLKSGKETLQQGKNTLEFQLEGQATKGTYIMFDFVDINGNVQSYGFTNKIQ